MTDSLVAAILSMLGPYTGYKMYESRYITVRRERLEERTWRERLLTFPWRPLTKYKKVYWEEPDPKVYMVGDSIFVHPETAKRIRESIEKL